MNSINSTPYSSLKLFAHLDKLEAIRNGERTSPLYVRIKPTNLCNQRCKYCAYMDKNYVYEAGMNVKDQISWEKMQEIINDLKDVGVKAVTFSGGGEPLIYPKINETMKSFLGNGIQISIITNGQRLCGDSANILKDAKWVRISIDSVNSEMYSKIRGVSLQAFDEVCNNIKEFSKIKNSDCELGINFVISKENADSVYEAAALFKGLGANHIKFTARITENVEQYHELIKQNVIEQIHRAINEIASESFRVINKYEEDFEHDKEFARKYSKCFIKEVVCVIGADSKIYLCHDKAYVKNGEIGDLKEKSFKEVWFSDETKEKMQKFNAQKECKHHCVYDDRNILMSTFFSLDENQINFI